MTGKKRSVRNSDSKPGPATLEGKARSLANLRPWKPGESGNAAGRTTYGASVREWLNSFADASRSELQAVIEDVDAPSAKQAAAAQALKASEGDGVAFDRCADRTEGRPMQTALIGTVSLDPAQRAAAAIEQARALLGLQDGVVKTG